MAALTVIADAADEGLHAVDHALQVDAEHPVPVVEGALVERAAGADAGVVAHQVHVAETILGAAGGVLHRVAVGDVELERQHLGAARFELGCRGGERLGLDVGEHDAHSLAGEDARHAEADAARAAGDEGCLAA